MTQRKCRFCLYWHSRLPSGIEPKDDSIGECRINPPAFTPLGEKARLSDKKGAWPEAYVGAWSGRFTLARWPRATAGYHRLPNLNSPAL